MKKKIKLYNNCSKLKKIKNKVIFNLKLIVTFLRMKLVDNKRQKVNKKEKGEKLYNFIF